MFVILINALMSSSCIKIDYVSLHAHELWILSRERVKENIRVIDDGRHVVGAYFTPLFFVSVSRHDSSMDRICVRLNRLLALMIE